MSPTDLDRFEAACVYPGKLDEQAVERELAKFLQALGVRRRIVRLRAGWRPEDDPPRNRGIGGMLAECVNRYRYLAASAVNIGSRDVSAAAVRGAGDAARYARGTRAAGAAALSVRAFFALRASLAARAFATFADPALFADSALTSVTGAANPATRALRAGWGSVWELSWSVCALFDRKRPAVEAWLRPLFEAFACGCWLLYWANDTLYWVAKPTLHREPGTQRLHHDAHAALESDFVNLYFWHGVMVPAFVIARPDLITLAHIDQEINAEVRRVMIERYRHGEEIHGAAAFIRDAGGERLDYDERYGTLWRRNIRGNARSPGDEPIVMIEVVNRTREPDGRFKHYWLRVPPTMRTAREAVAWTFNMRAREYAPEIET